MMTQPEIFSRPLALNYRGKAVFHCLKYGYTGRILTFWYHLNGKDFDVRGLSTWPQELAIATTAKIKFFIRQAIRKGEL